MLRRSGSRSSARTPPPRACPCFFEPLNRYEDHMVNTLAQGAELIRGGLPGVRLLADTYHMNIEEDDLCAALRAVADVLGAVHLSDSNRAQPGHGPRPVRGGDRDAARGRLRRRALGRVPPARRARRGRARVRRRFLRGLLDA